MFLFIYVDYFALYKPGLIDNLRAGVVFEFDISPTLLTMMLASVAIPAPMVMLSMTLPARVNRATNLVVASLNIPYSVFNCGSPEIVEGSLCRVSGEGGGLVVDRRQAGGRAVPALAVVEA